MRRSRNALIIVGLLLMTMAALIALPLVSAQNLPSGTIFDGRVNVVEHFGGDAFYCVDRNYQPIYDYSDEGFGGFRLLNIDGQEVWFLPDEDVQTVVDLAQASPFAIFLIQEAPSTYGDSFLYVYAEADFNNTIHFIYVANDEYGKQNQITFVGCTSRRPVVNVVLPIPTNTPIGISTATPTAVNTSVAPTAIPPTDVPMNTATPTPTNTPTPPPIPECPRGKQTFTNGECTCPADLEQTDIGDGFFICIVPPLPECPNLEQSFPNGSCTCPDGFDTFDNENGTFTCIVPPPPVCDLDADDPYMPGSCTCPDGFQAQDAGNGDGTFICLEFIDV